MFSALQCNRCWKDVHHHGQARGQPWCAATVGFLAAPRVLPHCVSAICPHRRSVEHLFEMVQAKYATTECKLTLTFVELYNNTFRCVHHAAAVLAACSTAICCRLCRDLLDFHSVNTPRKAGSTCSAAFAGPSSAKEAITIRDIPSVGVFLEGSASLRTPITSVEQTLELIKRCV